MESVHSYNRIITIPVCFNILPHSLIPGATGLCHVLFPDVRHESRTSQLNSLKHVSRLTLEKKSSCLCEVDMIHKCLHPSKSLNPANLITLIFD
jgi:hypothetical protein